MKSDTRSILIITALVMAAATAAYAAFPPPFAAKVLLLIIFGALGADLFMLWLYSARCPDPLDVDSLIPDEGPLAVYPTPASLIPTKKHPQMILAMDQRFFDGCVHFPQDLNVLAVEDFLSWQETASALALKERDGLERDEGFRQILPYVVVRQVGWDGVMRFFAYQRTKKIGEERLAGKCSIGIGGHIDATSVIFREDSTIDLQETIMRSAWRELGEELAIFDAASGDPLNLTELAFTRGGVGLIPGNMFITHNEGVQRVHLGVVLYLDVPVTIRIETAEEELQTLGMFDAEELHSFFTASMELEVWSQLLADRYASEVTHQPV